jgi:hypothetical protein
VTCDGYFENGAIKINYETDGVTLTNMLPDLKKVTDKKRLVLWGDFNEQDLIFIKQNLPAKNLCLQMNVDSALKPKSETELVNSIWNEGN